jgi:ActR/RegA family two-component response regulator
MVLICSKCEARLQLDEAKAPSRPFTVRCPKCQGAIDVQPPAASEATTAEEGRLKQGSPINADRAAFERPASAPPFKVEMEDSNANSTHPASGAGLDEVAKLLAAALSHADTATTRTRGRKRPAWDRRKILVCASPAYRDAIARSVANLDYEVFVAENSAQALGRMREERMDIVILDANFDPVEQGVAFVTREVKLLRPSERRRLFFVYVTSGVRTMDLHAAFLHNVNLVVNPSDLEQLPDALEVSVRHYNELYRDFNIALDVVPI